MRKVIFTILLVLFSFNANASVKDQYTLYENRPGSIMILDNLDNRLGYVRDHKAKLTKLGKAKLYSITTKDALFVNDLATDETIIMVKIIKVKRSTSLNLVYVDNTLTTSTIKIRGKGSFHTDPFELVEKIEESLTDKFDEKTADQALTELTQVDSQKAYEDYITAAVSTGVLTENQARHSLARLSSIGNERELGAIKDLVDNLGESQAVKDAIEDAKSEAVKSETKDAVKSEVEAQTTKAVETEVKKEVKTEVDAQVKAEISDKAIDKAVEEAVKDDFNDGKVESNTETKIKKEDQ